MILVCGGAGYIGSHMVAYLQEKGEDVIVVDNLGTGHGKAVGYTKLYVGDLRDKAFLSDVFASNKITSVIDFAAYSLVGESMQNPLKYFNNNVSGTISLLEVMVEHGVKNIVFSSTAAVYGEPNKVPIPETLQKEPRNAYGASKLMVENILDWCDTCHGIKYGVLRYFNVAGAHLSGTIGEHHNPESHLIPIIAEVALGKRDKLTIYGNDYPTPDGTCIRDYIHVMDLVDAHYLTLKNIQKTNTSQTYNLGNGLGFSVKEIVDAFESVIGTPIPKEYGERRAGDPATLIADYTEATTKLGWKQQYTDIKAIIESAWQWHKNNPEGYN